MIIILVEDNLVNQSLMKHTLMNNFKDSIVKVIGSGEAAITFFNSKSDKYDFNYHLIILDGNLGSEINGPEVAQAIVDAKIDTPVALWTTDKAMAEQMEKIFDRKLPRIEKDPFNKNNLIAVVRNVLGLESDALAPESNQRRMTY